MSKTRKLFSVVLALVMVFSLATVAFAVDYEEEAGNTQTWTLGDAVANGAKWDVPVSLKTNYATGAVQFDLVLSDGDLAIDSVAIGAGYPYTADINVSKSTKRVVIVPETGSLTGAEPASEAKAIDGVIATVTLTGTAGKVTIKNDPKTAAKPEGTLIALRLDEANIVTGNLIAGQTVTAEPNTVTIGAKPADLAVKTGAQTGIIIDTNKTFGGAYDGAVYGFVKINNTTFRNNTYLKNNLEATNDGTLAYTASSGTFYGTGAVVEVKNSDGTHSKNYVVIIFGDVNKDGFVNSNDAPAAKKNVSTWSKKNTIENFAANCQAITNALQLYTLNTNDLAAIKNYAGNKSNKFSETDLASKQFANTTYYK